jgi:uncharacterized pyridoxamine 5'-phosphate oxidase family protein
MCRYGDSIFGTFYKQDKALLLFLGAASRFVSRLIERTQPKNRLSQSLKVIPEKVYMKSENANL